MKSESGIKQPDRIAILMVDDRAENLLALEAVLKELDVRLVAATSGEEALMRVRDNDFAVILLDIAMPGLSGIETASLIRKRPASKNTPIIFLTAFQRPEMELVNTYNAGGVDYLVKPFHPEVLKAKVSVFVDLHKQRREIERQAELLRRSMLTIVEERKRTADERRRRQELEEFAHIASHDLKEPLRAIHAFSQLLVRNYGGRLPDEALELFSHVLEGARRINTLVDDLIEYAQVNSGLASVHDIGLNELVEEVVDRLQPKIRSAGATIHLTPLPSLPVNARQLGLVFEHLIDNALKFRAADRSPEITIRATEGQDRWLFEVQDNGMGFETRFAERVFLLFKRLHLRNEFEGTGFGLALCKRIIERHGGRIWAESEPGRGSTFFFALPAAATQWQTLEGNTV